MVTSNVSAEKNQTSSCVLFMCVLMCVCFSLLEFIKESEEEGKCITVEIFHGIAPHGLYMRL